MTKVRVKQTYRLDPLLVDLIEERASIRRVTKTDVIEAALAAFLSPDHEERLEAALTRRLDRIGRQLDRLGWHLDLSNETLALFVRFWLTANAPLPDTAMKAAQASGRKRWDNFVDALTRRMEAGPRLDIELRARTAPSEGGGSSSKGSTGADG